MTLILKGIFGFMAEYFNLPKFVASSVRALVIACFSAVLVAACVIIAISQSGGIIGTGSQPLALYGTVTQLGSVYVNGARVFGASVTGLPVGQKVILQAEATSNGIVAKGVVPLPLKVAPVELTPQGVSIFGRTVVGVMDGPMRSAIEHRLSHLYDGAWVQYQGVNVGSDGIFLSELRITSLPAGGASASGVLMRASSGSGIWQVSGVPIKFTKKALPHGYVIPGSWVDKVFNVSGYVEDGILMVETYSIDKMTSAFLTEITPPLILEAGYVKTQDSIAIATDLGAFSYPLESFPDLQDLPPVGMVTISATMDRDGKLRPTAYRQWTAGPSQAEFSPILTLLTIGAYQSVRQAD